MPRDTTELLRVVRGCTFDDFLLTPQLGIVPSRDPAVIDLTTQFTTQITLRRPIVSANMDTITRAAMAVALAEEGEVAAAASSDVQAVIQRTARFNWHRDVIVALLRQPWGIGALLARSLFW